MVARKQWRCSLVVLLVCGAVLSSALLGFLTGHQHWMDDAVERRDLSAQLGASKQTVAALENQLVDMELNAGVQQTALNVVRDDLTAARRENARLREEVSFYKGLMAPESLRKGLQVAEFQVETHATADGGAAYRFQLLLTQVALRRTLIAGEVSLELVGRSVVVEDGARNGVEVTLSLLELGWTDDYPLRFRFRYFQELSGQLVLPVGFTPERVVVSAQERGQEALVAGYAWTPLDGLAPKDVINGQDQGSRSD